MMSISVRLGMKKTKIHGSLTKALQPCAGSASLHTTALGSGPEGGRIDGGGDSSTKHMGCGYV
jgi:hypothetical protein